MAASPPSSDKMLMRLAATYASPTNAPFTLARALAPPPSGTAAPTVPDKTAYLASLRAAAAGLQEQVNRELTRRMEEDNNNNSSSSSSSSATKVAAVKAAALVDEARAEENYGEEAQEEEGEDE